MSSDEEDDVVTAEVPPEPEPAAPRSSRLSSAVGVLILAAGFALIPRATKGCEGGSAEGGDAPGWEAKIVANASAISPDTSGASPLTPPAPTTLRLESLRGRPVILDFWATWCGPCQMEAPIMNTIAQRYKDRGLAVVGVNTSDEDGLAAQFVKLKHLGFPMVYDEGNAIARKYGVQNLPTLVVISKTGKVVAVRTGVTSDSALDEIVRRYL